MENFFENVINHCAKLYYNYREAQHYEVDTKLSFRQYNAIDEMLQEILTPEEYAKAEVRYMEIFTAMLEKEPFLD